MLRKFASLLQTGTAVRAECNDDNGAMAATKARVFKSIEQLGKQREGANFVKKVFPEEFTRGPRVDTVPFGASITLDMHHANDSASSSK